eukprot:CAMPEP_0119434154 /NCGR_PEP_ID=MMETSP1335-20130426/50526_1 /TAXON_ID=259385 /ORGANISM="Chrysoculter rhomboideus, Strain RCC1486" /LENGTH=334 /DNA_ID=CAMNT_0007460009 /DNA_START=62 /DNA_END=1069 /DNA_ORIENTATION=-
MTDFHQVSAARMASTKSSSESRSESSSTVCEPSVAVSPAGPAAPLLELAVPDSRSAAALSSAAHTLQQSPAEYVLPMTVCLNEGACNKALVAEHMVETYQKEPICAADSSPCRRGGSGGGTPSRGRDGWGSPPFRGVRSACVRLFSRLPARGESSITPVYTRRVHAPAPQFAPVRVVALGQTRSMPPGGELARYSQSETWPRQVEDAMDGGRPPSEAYAPHASACSPDSLRAHAWRVEHRIGTGRGYAVVRNASQKHKKARNEDAGSLQNIMGYPVHHSRVRKVSQTSPQATTAMRGIRNAAVCACGRTRCSAQVAEARQDEDAMDEGHPPSEA